MKSLFYALIMFFAVSAVSHADFAARYKVQIEFEGPKYKWHRTVKFRDDFHFFLDNAPLKKGYAVGSIAGVVYPKKGKLYCTISMWASKKLKSEETGNSYSIGEVKFLAVPKSLKFDIPMSDKSGFKKCTVTLIPK
ncbi:MAG: hypothetical protein H7A51_13655 [Akkermansiaceae bacterium]|nr:hypothetical protein [Akkermansiaceae bacterium]